MSNLPTVVHLIDDTTQGGVMRVLDHIKTSPDLAALAKHRFVTVDRARVQFRRYDADVIVSHLAISWRTLPALLAIRAANRDKHLVHVEHSYTEGFVLHNVTNTRRFHALLRIGFSVFEKIVAVSHAQAAWFKRSRFCPQDKLCVIRSCVDLSPFKTVKPKTTPPKVFGAIGRLDQQKGIDALITAFRALPDEDISLFIYGSGIEFDRLNSLANGDPRIQFKGFQDDPLRAYEDVDVVVVPSRWEAYGLVAIEALCANRTVLCANVDGLRDHEEYGARLFDGYSEQDITYNLARMMADSRCASQNSLNSIGDDAQNAFVSGWKSLLKTLIRNTSGVSKEAMAEETLIASMRP